MGSFRLNWLTSDQPDVVCFECVSHSNKSLIRFEPMMGNTREQKSASFSCEVIEQSFLFLFLFYSLLFLMSIRRFGFCCYPEKQNGVPENVARLHHNNKLFVHAIYFNCYVYFHFRFVELSAIRMLYHWFRCCYFVFSFVHVQSTPKTTATICTATFVYHCNCNSKQTMSNTKQQTLKCHHLVWFDLIWADCEWKVVFNAINLTIVDLEEDQK